MITWKVEYLCKSRSLIMGAAFFWLCSPSCRAAEDLTYFDLTLEQLLDVPVTGSTLTAESLKTVPASV